MLTAYTIDLTNNDFRTILRGLYKSEALALEHAQTYAGLGWGIEVKPILYEGVNKFTINGLTHRPRMRPYL